MQTNSEGFSSNSNLRNFCSTHNTKLFFGWKHIKWPFIWCNAITFFKNTAPSSDCFVPGVKPIKNRVQKLWKKLSNSIKLQAGTTFKPISSAKPTRIFKNCSPRARRHEFFKDFGLVFYLVKWHEIWLLKLARWAFFKFQNGSSCRLEPKKDTRTSTNRVSGWPAASIAMDGCRNDQ